MLYRRTRRQTALHIDMTPMVDVMMLLVIFFMMSTVFVVTYPGFSVALPKASADQQPIEHITVMISKDGHIAVNGESVLRAGLAAKIGASGPEHCNVSIKADKDVSHGQVVEVMDDIRKAGVTKMSIAVEDIGR